MKISDLLESDNKDSYVFTGLYHSSDDQGNIVYKPPSTQGRKPKDTLPAIHNLVNKLFIKKFGVPVRNSRFGYNFHATRYGSNVFLINAIPSKTRIFVNQKVSDFTTKFNSSRSTFKYAIRLRLKNNPLLSSHDAMEFNGVINGLPDDFASLDEIHAYFIEKLDDSRFDDSREIINNAIESYISYLGVRLQTYVDGTEEVSIEDVDNYPEVEFMIYSTDKMKLVKVGFKDENI